MSAYTKEIWLRCALQGLTRYEVVPAHNRDQISQRITSTFPFGMIFKLSLGCFVLKRLAYR